MWYNYFGKLLVVSHKAKHITITHQIPLGIYRKEMKICICKMTCTRIFITSLFLTAKKSEITQMFNRITNSNLWLFVQWDTIENKKESTTDTKNNIDKSQKHVKWKKLDKKMHILFDSIYMKFKNRLNNLC